MNELALLLDEFLATRRALGAKLELPARLLKRFVFAAQHHSAFITTECALQWATEPRDAQPAQWASRLGMVRPHWGGVFPLPLSTAGSRAERCARRPCSDAVSWSDTRARGPA